MELVFLGILLLAMIVALSSGYPVAFSLPGAAILSISLAALFGFLLAGDSSAFFVEGGPFSGSVPASPIFEVCIGMSSGIP